MDLDEYFATPLLLFLTQSSVVVTHLGTDIKSVRLSAQCKFCNWKSIRWNLLHHIGIWIH